MLGLFKVNLLGLPNFIFSAKLFYLAWLNIHYLIANEKIRQGQKAEIGRLNK